MRRTRPSDLGTSGTNVLDTKVSPTPSSDGSRAACLVSCARGEPHEATRPTDLPAQKTDEISVPVAITVFPDEVVQAQERWARRAFPTLTYFRETERDGHFAMWEHPGLFAAEFRAAFHSVRGGQ